MIASNKMLHAMNRTNFLPFSVPWIEADDIQAVVEVLKSGWITTGPRTAEFEKAVADKVGAPFACAMSSGTAGWHCVALALKLRPGDEVIMPSMTWVSDANVVELLGAKPVFVDVDRSTMLAPAAAVAAAVTPRTRAILPVHFAGAPVDMDAYRAIAEKNGLALVEDAAHAIGAEYKGKKVGAEGTAIFSLHPIKNITTAEGGIVACQDEKLYEAIKRLKFHGLAKDAWDRYSKNGTGTVLEVVEPGLKYNLSDMLAALGITQLSKLERFNSRRAVLAGRYDRLFSDIPEILPLSAPMWPHVHAHHLYVVRINSPRLNRDDFVAGLKERNIGTGIHFKAVHLHSYYRRTGRYPLGSLPETEWCSERLCSLPLFPAMTDADQEDVVAAVRDVLALAGNK
jgi:UDP-4-amino-4-deoxy-L-arabinose-oxoglutarate aminotransferase